MTLHLYTVNRVGARFTGVCTQCDYTVTGLSGGYIDRLMREHTAKCKPVRYTPDPDIPWMTDYILEPRGSIWHAICAHCPDTVSRPRESSVRRAIQTHVLRNHYRGTSSLLPDVSLAELLEERTPPVQSELDIPPF